MFNAFRESAAELQVIRSREEVLEAGGGKARNRTTEAAIKLGARCGLSAVGVALGTFLVCGGASSEAQQNMGASLIGFVFGYWFK